ncbi:MAG: ABC transporter ATP-binding protein [Xanthomonadales bacterium]|nr:ABC transporter ATP-binding protein [Xanthomonadales bacterium]
MTQEQLLCLERVSVTYTSGLLRRQLTRALNEVSFSLNRGESLGVIGRNGSGKSTLMRVLADIIRPTSGNLRRSPGIRAALLALKVGFLPHLTGRENAFLSGMMLGMSRAEVRRRMDAIIEFSGLEDFIDDPLYTYSSGMKMRLAFSAGYQFEPDILLLDELLGVGDATFKHKSARVMRERIRSNATVVMVTHNTSRIVDLCDRLIWLEQGTIQADGTPEHVLPAYEDFVQQLKASGSVRLKKATT